MVRIINQRPARHLSAYLRMGSITCEHVADAWIEAEIEDVETIRRVAAWCCSPLLHVRRCGSPEPWASAVTRLPPSGYLRTASDEDAGTVAAGEAQVLLAAVQRHAGSLSGILDLTRHCHPSNCRHCYRSV